MIKIYAPASIGNINVGFDILGISISPINNELLGDSVSIKYSKIFDIKNTGRFCKDLPLNIKDNIIYTCWKEFCNIISYDIPVLIELEKNLPIGSGLGSSACSIVASLTALNKLCNNPINNLDLLKLMGKLEGKISGNIHYDNVAPCFLGGLQLILNSKKNISTSIPFFKNLFWIIAYPGTTINTYEARSILPKNYTIDNCINYGRNLSGFIHACYIKDLLLALEMMKDYIAEPYRINLIPNFNNIRNITHTMGALICGIAGSGPTLFFICDNYNNSQNISDWLKKYYIYNNNGFVNICNIDYIGARSI